MIRGTTARTVVSILAAVLLALPFFTPTACFASAHTTRHVLAKAKPETKPSGKTLRDEFVTCRDAGHTGDPTGPLHNRNRYLTAGCVLGEPEPPLLALNPPPAHQPVTAAAAHHRTSRSSTAHSPAALQVFRC